MTELLFNARGYISRKQFWVGVGVLVILQSVIAGLMVISDEKSNPTPVIATCFLVFVTIWIWLSIVMKRLNARGKSGLWALITFIPFIGLIWAALDLGFALGKLARLGVGVQKEECADRIDCAPPGNFER